MSYATRSMTRAEIEDFLYREAALLDDGHVAEWLALWAAGGPGYVVPTADAPDGDPRTHLAYIADDLDLLRTRVSQLLDRTTVAEIPRTRTTRIVGNVRVLDRAARNAVSGSRDCSDADAGDASDGDDRDSGDARDGDGRDSGDARGGDAGDSDAGDSDAGDSDAGDGDVGDGDARDGDAGDGDAGDGPRGKVWHTSSRFVLHAIRHDRSDVLSGRYEHVLAATASGLRILGKRVILNTASIPIGRLSFLL